MISKRDLVATTAKELGISQKDCLTVIDTFFKATEDAIALREVVVVGDLGKFVPVETKPTEAKTLKSGLTGKMVDIPAKPAGVKATFKISKKIKDIVSGK